MKTAAGDVPKPYMVSISGHNLKDNLGMLKKIMTQYSSENSGISAVELNLACPNVIGHPIIAYDFEQMDAVLQAVSDMMLEFTKGSNGEMMIPLGVKMPPYFDTPHFESAAKVLNKYKSVVNYVASINTFGNAFAVDLHSEMPVISSKGGFAGLSGKAVKHTALANVRMMRTLLDEDIDVIGVGGVSTGADAFEMILCGAAAVQVGTCHWSEGPSCFDRICKELELIMIEKGYSCIKDFQNKLKPWSKEGASASRANRKTKETAIMKKAQYDTATADVMLLLFVLSVGLVFAAKQTGMLSF